LPELQASIDASPTGTTTFINGEKGGAFTKESFGNWFREVCNEAGVQKSAHGLRKAGATRAAENGATENELDAIFGWTGGGMAATYTRAANRKKLSRASIGRLTREPT
jgi:integrase